MMNAAKSGKVNIITVLVCALTIILFTSFVFANFYERSLYVQHVETKADITSGYTWYKVCNPTSNDFQITKNTDFNVTFIINKSTLTNSEVQIRKNFSGIRNITSKTCNPYHSSTTLENGTVITDTYENCSEIIIPKKIEEYKWETFIPTNSLIKANSCQDIKVIGNYPPAYGKDSVNIDNVLGYKGMYFSEYALWQTGWERRKAFYVNESNNTKRTNYPLGLLEATGGEARSACINFSNLDNYNSKQGELRVIDNSTNASVPFEVISNTTDSVCIIPIVNLTANENNGFYLYWNNSNAPSIQFTTDFASVSSSSLQVANHEFSFKGSILSGLDNYSFGRNLDGQEFWNGITNDNGAGTALARNTGSCNIKDINGSVVKWVNCSNSGAGMLCMFAAYNNFTRCTFSGFNTNADDGMYVTCGDGSSSDSSIHFRGNDGVMLTGHGESGMVRDSAGILGCGKDAYSTKAFMYWNASWTNLYTRANSTASYTRNGVGADPQITVATTSFHGNYRWNLNSVNVYVGITGNSSDAVRETWAWLENKPIITFGQNETFSTSPTYPNEQEGRTAIEAGINSSIIGTSANRYTDQKIYARNFSNAQVLGAFDKVAESGNQRWAFNYITGSDTNVNMFNLTPSLYTLELNSLTTEQITDTVGKLINNTKQ